MSQKRILVIEDDSAVREGVIDALRFDGYEVFEAGDGINGLRMAEQAEYDLLLLDLMLPGKDGIEILERVRAIRPTLPIIIVTARGAESDRVKGLRLGADDYVVKPFGAKELLARVEAVLRRSPERPLDVTEIQVPAGTLDLECREFRSVDGNRQELSEREVELLRYLAANSGRVISREEILSRVWRMEPRGVETRTIDMHIARLREKIEKDPATPEVILTVRGKGYRLVGK